ncbi:putative oxidoreductase, aryl-alcohol dehydrogenase like protein [Halobacteroides halobius DSM 5150]|uniref:Putative oxidoreductase, aryl-alcohol dehydrogenase like protein n=1 Tax=Halobacteroides halobius (strain ATCC 35273 / DSM 5150 / MD-1) TaxID=748449 RepID=L0K867_HALHC|nr:aldo/keto reductase [Halobacteroides halobius]AGB40283.1 putative oxidoreductase, aryl-alcohol dehydrogenase like protein [Halobacteroides halobius DSM 5150]
MDKRKLGNTGLEVSEIGFGSWQLGNTTAWKGASQKEAIKLVHQALELGCNFFDTAPNYARGNSEKILGKALNDRREEVVISTKFGHFSDGTVDYDFNLIRESVENSLNSLQTDYLDSVLLHNPPFEFLTGSTPHFEILQKLKDEGIIKAYGASVDTSEEMLALIENTKAEVIEVMFNILYQEPRKVFDKAKEAGVGLIIKVPLDSGWLTGKYNKNSNFTGIRARWSQEVIERRAQLVDKIKQIKSDQRDMVDEALRFILSYPEVSTVIPGIRNRNQLEQNLNANNKEMLKSLQKEYESFYKDNLAGNELPW